jgi:hypothetical protein
MRILILFACKSWNASFALSPTGYRLNFKAGKTFGVPSFNTQWHVFIRLSPTLFSHPFYTMHAQPNSGMRRDDPVRPMHHEQVMHMYHSKEILALTVLRNVVVFRVLL